MFNIHLALGFHVNLYHSYRGDSVDDSGIGPDIQMIRRILSDLDALNQAGIPVRGAWDFDNHFSLETRIPHHAPDILANLQRRVTEQGDEILLGSYNNGLASCMTDSELHLAMKWAAANPFGSGVRDLFTAYAPVVRPQEMMFTASNIPVYKDCGIKAVCLYYSSAPVDSFRTLIPLLPEEEAFNPMSIRSGGDVITVVPAITWADLLDHGGIKSMARRLHARQLSGEIASDILIFVNMDADSFVWGGVDLPFPFNKISLAKGLHQLVRDAAQLPYVVFDTPWSYLKGHPPLASIELEHDLADGSFDGYASWTEKPINQLLWTRLERIRQKETALQALIQSEPDPDTVAEAQALAASVELGKSLLLSTTHFGLAAPMLNLSRELSVLQQSSQILSLLDHQLKAGMASELDRQVVKKALEDPEPAGYFLKLSDVAPGFSHHFVQIDPGFLVEPFILTWLDDQGRSCPGSFLPVEHHPDGSVARVEAFLFPGQESRSYRLVLQPGLLEDPLTEPLPADRLMVERHKIHSSSVILMSDEKDLAALWLNGQKIGPRSVFTHAIRYKNGLLAQDLEFAPEKKQVITGYGSHACAGFRFTGQIHLPEQVVPGSFAFDYYLVPSIPALFIRFSIQYPQTLESEGSSDEISHLDRAHDTRWLEVKPLEIQLDWPFESQVIKRNYQDHWSQFPVQSFAAADPANASLDSFNHQVSAGIVGVSHATGGFLIATDRSQISSPAYCPMRLRQTRQGIRLSLNPFGTYHGRQRHHASHAGQVPQIFLPLASAHLRSLAPAYNGTAVSGTVALIPFEGPWPSQSIRALATQFADGQGLCSMPDYPIQTIKGDSVRLNESPVMSSAGPSYRSMTRKIPLPVLYKAIRGMIKSRARN